LAAAERRAGILDAAAILKGPQGKRYRPTTERGEARPSGRDEFRRTRKAARGAPGAARASGEKGSREGAATGGRQPPAPRWGPAAGAARPRPPRGSGGGGGPTEEQEAAGGPPRPSPRSGRSGEKGAALGTARRAGASADRRAYHRPASDTAHGAGARGRSDRGEGAGAQTRPPEEGAEKGHEAAAATGGPSPGPAPWAGGRSVEHGEQPCSARKRARQPQGDAGDRERLRPPASIITLCVVCRNVRAL